MGMRADDGVGPLGHQPAGKTLLLGAVPGFVFHAPVGEHQDDIGLLTGAGHDRRQGFAAHAVHLGPMDGRSGVGAVGEVHQGHPDALDGQDKGVQQRVGPGRCRRPRVQDISFFQLADGAGKPLETLVQHVVVGGEENVEAHIRKVFGKRLGAGEDGVAGIGLPGQREFHVAHGHVGLPDIPFHVFEEIRIAVNGGALHHPAVRQHISHQVEGEGIGLGGDGPVLYRNTNPLRETLQRNHQKQYG